MTALDVVALEGGRSTSMIRRLPGRGRRRVVTALALLVVGLWTASHLGIGRRALVNGRGFGELGRFFASAIRPDLSVDLLQLAWSGAKVTLAYALLGTIASVGIGLVLGVLITPARRDGRIGPVAAIIRTLLIPIRGAHEVLWALLFLNILGINPIVAVLSIAIPFGAVTARVFSEILAAQPRDAYRALRAGGATETIAFVYGVVPNALGDGTSYTFYRFECAVRAAAVLGVVGAGGLGEQLRLSFLAPNYREMWTFLYVLIALSASADALSARVRKQSLKSSQNRTLLGRSLATFLCAALSWWVLKISPSTLWSVRTRDLASQITKAWLPPNFDFEQRRLLWGLMGETLAISIGSILLSALIAIPAAFITARGIANNPARRLSAFLGRGVLLVSRAIPPSVWAYLCVLVFFPGALPATIALGIYNAGVLGRLMAEAVENLDRKPQAALIASGARSLEATLYGVVPIALPTFTQYSLYRWEVAMRETITVGIVAAGGLGAHLNQRLAAFDWRSITTTIGALMILTAVVELVGFFLRQNVRTSG
jgi:phosphonate transport system permease protein